MPSIFTFCTDTPPWLGTCPLRSSYFFTPSLTLLRVFVFDRLGREGLFAFHWYPGPCILLYNHALVKYNRPFSLTCRNVDCNDPKVKCLPAPSFINHLMKGQWEMFQACRLPNFLCECLSPFPIYCLIFYKWYNITIYYIWRIVFPGSISKIGKMAGGGAVFLGTLGKRFWGGGGGCCCWKGS